MRLDLLLLIAIIGFIEVIQIQGICCNFELSINNLFIMIIIIRIK
jgi:hypothetical protein